MTDAQTHRYTDNSPYYLCKRGGIESKALEKKKKIFKLEKNVLKIILEKKILGKKFRKKKNFRNKILERKFKKSVKKILKKFWQKKLQNKNIHNQNL